MPQFCKHTSRYFSAFFRGYLYIEPSVNLNAIYISARFAVSAVLSIHVLPQWHEADGKIDSYEITNQLSTADG